MNKFVLGNILLLLALPAWSLNDPMRPPFYDGASNSSPTQVVRPLELSMILFANDRKVAVLNGQTVKVGESVMGYRVLRIDRDRVVVSKKGRVKEVLLGNSQQRGKTTIKNHTVAGD